MSDNPDNQLEVAMGWNIHRKRKALSALRFDLIKRGFTGHTLAVMDASQISAFLSAGRASVLIGDLPPEDLERMLSLVSEFEGGFVPKEKKPKAPGPAKAGKKTPTPVVPYRHTDALLSLYDPALYLGELPDEAFADDGPLERALSECGILGGDEIAMGCLNGHGMMTATVGELVKWLRAWPHEVAEPVSELAPVGDSVHPPEDMSKPASDGFPRLFQGTAKNGLWWKLEADGRLLFGNAITQPFKWIETRKFMSDSLATIKNLVVDSKSAEEVTGKFDPDTFEPIGKLVTATMDEPPGSERPPFKHPTGPREVVVDKRDSKGTVYPIEPMEPLKAPGDATEAAMEAHRQNEPLPEMPTVVDEPEGVLVANQPPLEAPRSPMLDIKREDLQPSREDLAAAAVKTTAGSPPQIPPPYSRISRKGGGDVDPLRWALMDMIREVVGDTGAQVNKAEIQAMIDAALVPFMQRLEDIEEMMSGPLDKRIRAALASVFKD